MRTYRILRISKYDTFANIQKPTDTSGSNSFIKKPKRPCKVCGRGLPLSFFDKFSIINRYCKNCEFKE